MSYDDEDDLPTSSREYMESPAKAKLEAVKRKLEAKGRKDEAVKAESNLSALQLSVLQSQVAGKQDDERKRADENAKPLAAGTKTREQELAASKLEGDTQMTTDQIVEENKADAVADQEIQATDVTGEGG